MLIEVAGSLIPGTVNTPLDQRTRVNALSEVAQIESPFVGMKFYCLATGKTYTVKSLKEKLIGSFTVQDALINEYEADPDVSDLSDWSGVSDRVGKLETASTAAGKKITDLETASTAVGKKITDLETAVAALQENDAAALAIIGEEET